MDNFEIIVVGKGMLGSSAAKHLAELGASVLNIGPGEPKIKSTHRGVFGSHHDSGRITRILDRNPYYAKVAEASISRFRGLEKQTGINFYHDVGQITVSGMHPYLDELTDCANSHKLNHFILDDKGIESTFPYLNFKKGMTGIYEIGTAGHIDPRKFIKSQLEATKISGGQIIEETVIKIKDNNGFYSLSTENNEKYNCKKVLLAIGAFANHLGIIPKPISIEIAEHTVVLGEIDNETAKYLFEMPSVIYHLTDEIRGSVYILPPIKYPDGRLWIKIGQSRGNVMSNPEKNLIPWFQSHGDNEIAQWLLSELSTILPEIKFISTHSESCVTTKSKSGYQFIDKFEDTEIYSCLVGDGQAAKSADEIGRIAAHDILYSTVPNEYAGMNFRNEYL